MKIVYPGSDGGHCPLFIGTGILADAQNALSGTEMTYRPFLITDKNLIKHGHAAALGIESSASYIIDPPGETSKCIKTVTNILNTMDERGFGRDTVILALGGGTVGDIAGFAASIFKRGIPVIQIPTTTVSQADSSIGGKTGVNSDWSKNAIGTFWNPRAIVMDIRTLETLDERHYVSGLAESVKHGLVANAAFFEWITEHTEAIKRREPKELTELARRNAQIKSAVVEHDPQERNGFRFILNFGHTIGHAIETASHFRVLHGEGVAIGMIGAMRLGSLLGVTPENLTERVERSLCRLGLPIRLPRDIEPDRLPDIMIRDKKAKDGYARFVLLKEAGDVLVREHAYAHAVNTSLLTRVCQSLHD